MKTKRTLGALVNILGTVYSFISSGAGAGEGPVDRASVTDCALMTWIRRTGIIKMTKQTYKKNNHSSFKNLIFILSYLLYFLLYKSF